MKHRRMFAHALFRVALFSLLLPLAASSHAASTNVAAPIVNWSNLGAPTESPSGVFTFTVLQATNYPQRIYRVTTP